MWITLINKILRQRKKELYLNGLQVGDSAAYHKL